MNQPLLDLIITQEDRRELLDFLEILCQDLFKTDSSYKDAVGKNEKYGPTLSKILPKDIAPGELDKKIREIISQIENIKDLKVILAVKPTKEVLSAISVFAQKKYGTKQILSIEIDPKILGGAVFIQNGKYMDLSVATRLTKEFEGKDLKSLIN